MDFYEFSRLNQDQREALVKKRGIFLAVRMSCGCKISLYHMSNFYAEVVYLPESNEIILVRSFKSKSCLDPYLEMVDLSGILI
jgi:hypothetical protein